MPAARPLTGATPIGDLVRELEADPEMSPRLARARRALAGKLDPHPTFRQLRLSKGMSQSMLAALAGTTQSYIARMESATVDPGTDMLARVAGALELDELMVFSAVRNLRMRKG